MTRVELQDLCSELSIGKRLPGVCYLAREAIDSLPPRLKELIDHLTNQTGETLGALGHPRSEEGAGARRGELPT